MEDNGKYVHPEYVLRKSAWAGVTFLRVILFWLIIPLIIMIVDIIIKKRDVVEFYDGYAIHKSGLLSKHEDRIAVGGIAGISVNQNIWQRIWGYGDMYIDFMGKGWDISTSAIKDPIEAKNFLNRYIVNTAKTATEVFAN